MLYEKQPTRFIVTPNAAPFCANHFLVWPEPSGYTGLKQVYQNNLLFWADDLFSRLDDDYSLFYSAKGTGNSIDTLHFQVLKMPFPAFEYLNEFYKGMETCVKETDRTAWPLFGVFARYNCGTKDKVLGDLDSFIQKWLSADSARTFNLLFTARADVREAFFIFRKKGVTLLPGMKNEFAGCEAGGNIIIEDWDDYKNFPAETARLELVSGTG
jgi:hypothetical protein